VPHPGTDAGVDLWWSGKHDNHGGNVQVITAPDGWPLWTSPVRPGREHDTTALREHDQILPLFTVWTDDDLRVLGDLGYEGEATTITVAYKKPKNAACTYLHEVRPSRASFLLFGWVRAVVNGLAAGGLGELWWLARCCRVGRLRRCEGFGRSRDLRGGWWRGGSQTYLWPSDQRWSAT
jgi:hypothetical protein